MINIAPALTQYLSQPSSAQTTPPLKLSFPESLPPSIAGKITTAEVIKADQNGKIILQTNDGKQVTAKAEPPLPVGSKLTFTATAKNSQVLTLDIPKAVLEQAAKELAQQPTPLPQQGQQNGQQQTGQNNAQQQHPQGQPLPPQQQAQTAQTSAQNNLLKTTFAKLQNMVQQPRIMPDLSSSSMQQQFIQMLKSTPLPIMAAKPNMPLPQAGQQLPMQVVNLPTRGSTSQLAQELTQLPTNPTAAQAKPNGIQVRFNPPLPVPTGTTMVMKFLTQAKADVGQIQLPQAPLTTPQPTTTTPQDAVQIQTPAPAQTSARQLVLQQPISANTANQIPTTITRAVVIETTPLPTTAVAPTTTAQPTAQPAMQATLQLANGHTVQLPVQQPVTAGSTLFIRTLPPPTAAAQPVAEIMLPAPTQSTSTTATSSQPTVPQGTHIPLQANGPRVVPQQPFSQPAGSQIQLTVSQEASAQAPQTVLTRADGQTYTVQTPQRLPVGTQVILEVNAPTQAQITTISLPNTAPEAVGQLASHSYRWSALEQALHALQHQSPEHAAKLMHALPRADVNILPQLLAFQNAVQQQNLAQWAGDDTINIIRALGIDLTADSQNLIYQQPRIENQSGEPWRAFFFPYLDDQRNLRQGQFYWRKETDPENPQDAGVRFLLNLSLSQLGDVQLNGLSQKKNLNFNLHMATDPGENHRLELRQLVGQSLESLGLKGTLHFRISEPAEFDPLYEIIAAVRPRSVTI